VTFSEPTEITAAFEGLRHEYAWRVLATGPGHGIQASNGRLLVPVWLSLGTHGNAHRPSRVTTVTSDDNGKTWTAGTLVPVSGAVVNPSETAAIELGDGRIMLNMRHAGPKRLRAVTMSPDGSGNWTLPFLDAALPEPVCFASLCRVPGVHGVNGDGIILFSNPHNASDTARKNLSIKASPDDGKTWPIMKTLEPGLSAYSDLAVGPDGTIYCFFERGVDGTNSECLTLASFDLDWLE
jgi:sialidase-1